MRTCSLSVRTLLLVAIMSNGCSSYDSNSGCGPVADVIDVSRSIEANQVLLEEILGSPDNIYMWGDPLSTECLELVYGDTLMISLYTKPIRNSQIVLPIETTSEASTNRRYVDEIVIGFKVAIQIGSEKLCETSEGETTSYTRFK